MRWIDAVRGKIAPQGLTGAALLVYAIGCMVIATIATNRDEILITIGIGLGALAGFLLLILPYAATGVRSIVAAVKYGRNGTSDEVHDAWPWHRLARNHIDDQAHETPTTPPITVSLTLPMYTPQELVDRITALAEGLAIVEGIKDAEVYLIRTCRGCGCTDEEGCFGGCWWTSETDDLCSSCAPQKAATGAER